MEMHHKLRRDKSWSIHGCNTCGQEGHQAANCPNGSNDFKALGFDYHVYESIKPKLKVDFETLEARARAYAAAMGKTDDPAVAAQAAADVLPAALDESKGGGWKSDVDFATGRRYWYNELTCESRWHPPQLQPTQPQLLPVPGAAQP
eukprot:PRCOL_00006977-RA